MTRGTSHPTSQSIDRDLVARVVQEVMARLTDPNTSKTDSTAAAIEGRVVSVDMIERIQGAPRQLFVSHGAIITPAARDEANRRGMAVNRTVEISPSQQPHHSARAAANRSSTVAITDPQQPERAQAIANQLAKRGISRLPAGVVFSDRPAADVHRYCAVDAQRAVMIASLADVDRFAVELNPTVWVLDMARLNLVTAVNIVARIAQRTV